MPTHGPNSPGTVALNAMPEVAINDPDNVKVSDGNYATFFIFFEGQETYGLLCSNFGFDIPTGETIVGVTVEVECIGASPTVDFAAVILQYGGSSESNNLAAGSMPDPEAYVPFGGATELWGTGSALTPAVVNNSNFGTRMAWSGTGTGLVDHVRVTVHTTSPTGPATYSSLTGAGK